MSRLAMKRIVCTLVLVFVAACADDEQITAPFTPPTEAPLLVELTPYQASVDASVTDRLQRGLPAPDVSFTYESSNGVSLSELEQYPGQPGESFTLVATTIIRYDGPSEAGLDEWGTTEVTGDVLTDEGVVREGNYDEDVRRFVDDRLPGYWDRHDFGQEPRTHRITETITVTYPGSGSGIPRRALVDTDLVHGLTILGPDIDWTVKNEACIEDVCAWKFRAGFAVDWGFGIRLPMNVSLDADAAVDEGDTFTPTSMADGADWSAAQFTAAGIAPEDGNEFVMRYEFFLGVQVEVAGISVIDVGPDVDENASSSFKTPFGPGAVFNLPGIDLPIYSKSVSEASATFGATFTPQAGSDKFTAAWLASTGLIGSGALTYTDPADTENLSSIFAVDGPNAGNVQINNSKYVFNQYKIALGAYFEIDIFGLFDERYDIPITDFDLSSLIPDIAVPIHPGASPTVLNSGVTVNNVAPTAAVDLSGAQLINGSYFFFADVGEVIPFQGSSDDPGLDDLVVDWSWGDGTPDTSTPYPLPGGSVTGPNIVLDLQPHAYAEACVYPVSFTSTDSDGASNQDGAFALIRVTTGTNVAELPGYWLHQFRGNGNVDFGASELECLLSIVNATSDVFSEAVSATTVAEAEDVMQANGSASEAERLDRALMVAWMNFANGVFELDQLVDTDLDLVPDTPFGVALANAEAVRLGALATDGELQMQREIVHNISAQAAP